MSIKLITTFAMLALASITTYGQFNIKDLHSINEYAIKHIKNDSVPDLSALITCNLKIIVDKKRHYKPEIVPNNLSAFNKIKGLNSLTNFDFKAIMGNVNSAVFILPVSIIVLDTRYQREILLNTVYNEMSELFYYPKNNEAFKEYIHLPPILMMIDKKKYN